MKKLHVLFVLFLAIASTALAEKPADGFFGAGDYGNVMMGKYQTTPTPAASGIGRLGPISMDQNGRVDATSFVSNGTNTLGVEKANVPTGMTGLVSIPGGYERIASYTITTGSTSTVVAITGASTNSRAGDILYFTGGTAANVRAWAVIDSVATNSVTLAHALPATPANGDTAKLYRFTPLFVNNGAAGGNNASSLSVAMDAGEMSTALATNLLKLEDAASASGDAGVSILVVREDALTSSVGATGDYSNLKADSSGRLIIASSPPGEMWRSSNTAVTTATTTTLKSSVASNYIHLTSFSCTNTGSTGTLIDLEDGAGTVYAYCNLAAVTGQCDVSFPNVPARLPLASSLNLKVFTGGGSVLCAAIGYLSTQ